MTFNKCSINGKAYGDPVDREGNLVEITEVLIYIYFFIGITCPSVCPAVVLSLCPIVSTQYLLNCSTIFFFIPNVVWSCIITRWCFVWKNGFTIFNCQGRSKGLHDQNMTIFTICSKLLQLNLVCWYSIINWSVLLKNVITAFKVKVTLNVQNVSECVSRQY